MLSWRREGHGVPGGPKGWVPKAVLERSPVVAMTFVVVATVVVVVVVVATVVVVIVVLLVVTVVVALVPTSSSSPYSSSCLSWPSCASSTSSPS